MRQESGRAALGDVLCALRRREPPLWFRCIAAFGDHVYGQHVASTDTYIQIHPAKISISETLSSTKGDSTNGKSTTTPASVLHRHEAPYPKDATMRHTCSRSDQDQRKLFIDQLRAELKCMRVRVAQDYDRLLVIQGILGSDAEELISQRNASRADASDIGRRGAVCLDGSCS